MPLRKSRSLMLRETLDILDAEEVWTDDAPMGRLTQYRIRGGREFLVHRFSEQEFEVYLRLEGSERDQLRALKDLPTTDRRS